VLEIEARGVEAPLEAALVRQVETRLREIPDRALFRSARRPLLALGALALLFAGLFRLAVGTPVVDKAGFALGDLRRGVRTGLCVNPGDTEIPTGTDLAVTVLVRRWQPDASIRVRRASGTEVHPMNPGRGPESSFTLYEVEEALSYRIETPSLTSRWYRVRAFVPPRVREAEITAVPPAYTLLPEVRVGGLQDLEIAEGSRVRVRILATDDAEVVLESESLALPTERDPAGGWFWQWTADAPVAYRFLLRDPEGHELRTPEYRLGVIPDRPPLVEILEPTGDVRALSEHVVPFRARASDDFGVGRGSVVVGMAGEPRREIELDPRPVAGNPRAFDLAYDLNLTELGAEPGDVVTVLFRCEDNREPGPQTGMSVVRFVEVREVITPSDGGEGEGEQERQELAVAPLIAELKRLIRLSWSAALMAGTDEDLAESCDAIERGLRDLDTEAGRVMQQIQAAGGGGPLGDLLVEAREEMQAAATWMRRALPDQAIPPEERALSALIRLEMALQRNAMQSRQSQGQQQQSQQGQGKQGQERQQGRERQSAWDRARELGELAERLRRAAGEQDDLNERLRSAFRDQDSSRLAAEQRDLADIVSGVNSDMARLAELAVARRHTGSALTEMARSREQLEQDQADAAHRHGGRAHNRLLEAVDEVERARRAVISEQLRAYEQAASALSQGERSAAEQSADLAGREAVDQAAQDAALSRQEGLTDGVRGLQSAVRGGVAALEQEFAEAAEGLARAVARQEQLNTEGAAQRAGNALLYGLFDRAEQEQLRAANHLQQFAADLREAMAAMPGFSQEEIANALRRLNHARQEVRDLQEQGPEGTAARLEQLRQESGRTVDRLASQLGDDNLQRIGDAMGMPGPGQAPEALAEDTAALLEAAVQVLERYAATAAVQNRLRLRSRAADPPEGYGRLVEQYFKDLSAE
jgi:hypothetical protein